MQRIPLLCGMKHFTSWAGVWVIAMLLISAPAQAQDDDLIQLSGVVATGDTVRPIPYATIFIPNRAMGTVTDYDGFFSMVVHKGDTLQFSSMGFKTSEFWVPDTLKKSHYSLVMTLLQDTIVLAEQTLYPWPSKEQFKQFFLAMEPPTDDLQRAKRNMALETIRRQAEQVGYDPQAMAAYMNNYNHQQLYNAGRYYGENGGQAVLGALTNPFAWAEFFRALKRGDFSSDRYE
jgi:hypothetical protein